MVTEIFESYEKVLYEQRRIEAGGVNRDIVGSSNKQLAMRSKTPSCKQVEQHWASAGEQVNQSSAKNGCGE